MATKKKAKKKSIRNRSAAPVVDPVTRELQVLQLEELRMSLNQKKAVIEMRKINSEAQELQLRKSREDVRRLQAACNHRKGGKDKAGIGNGNDSDYAVIKHTYPNMGPSVLCQRCQMDWRRGTTERVLHTGEPNHTRISFETAMAWPTDNEPSSATFFLIPSGDSALMAQIRDLQSQLAGLQAQGIHVA